MHFLSNGDYNFPLDWLSYWAKHYYTWSFQTGTPNPDGLIRFPGRILNFLVFALFGNIAVGYFYSVSSLVIAGIAFYFFCRRFLEIKNHGTAIVAAIFFACNPIFLGNLSKVGLVLAVAMLPLCLIAIKASFARRRVRLLLWWVLCLNVSLLHPYTFTVNLVLSGSYALYLAWKQRGFVIRHWYLFAVFGACAILLNAYIILPILRLGSVSRDVLSANIAATPADYTALINVANTGNIFTGLAMSKNVFLDFDFYNDTYQIIYFFGIFAFYILLFGIYLKSEKNLKQYQKRQLVIFLALFLVLVALATTTFLGIATLIKWLIGLPGGWAFRSPLKWQLYIPFALFSILALLVATSMKRGLRSVVVTGLAITFLSMNGYVAAQVYQKQLTPRSFSTFAGLEALNLTHQTLLFVNNTACQNFMPYNSPMVTELNQIFTSKDMQVKRVWEDNTSSINLASYNYILGCKDHLASIAEEQFGFRLMQTFAGGSLHLYRNSHGLPPVSIQTDIYAVRDMQSVAADYHFASTQLGQRPQFLLAGGAQTSGLQDIFGIISPAGLAQGSITTQTPIAPGTYTLYAQTGSKPLYYQYQEDHLVLSPTKLRNTQQIVDTVHSPTSLAITQVRNTFSATYVDPTFQNHNLVRNPSFESGLWTNKVSDCFAYDKQPAIGMQLTTATHTSGEHALELYAKRHIACTGPGAISVTAGSHYLISFDYQSPDKPFSAGYYLGFDTSSSTIQNVRLENIGTGWQHFSKIITVPAGATHMRLLLYGYPGDGSGFVTARFDSVGIFELPDIQARFYLTPRQSQLQAPGGMQYWLVNPTKKVIRIRSATGPFYLATNDSYHHLWQLSLTNGSNVIPLADDDHVALNGTMNAWYIDPAKLCRSTHLCTANADGSVDMRLVATFVPQKWFTYGLLVSSITLVGCIIFTLWPWRRPAAWHIWSSRR